MYKGVYSLTYGARLKSILLHNVLLKNKFLLHLYEERNRRMRYHPQGLYRHLNEEQKKAYRKREKKGELSHEIRLDGGTEYPDKTFFIVRRAQCCCGLMQHYHVYAAEIEYALSRGYIPVVDMQYYQNIYQRENEVGKINTWEYFFDQPTEFDLEDAYRAKNLIMADVYPTKYLEGEGDYKKRISDIRKITGKYLRPKREIVELAERAYRENIGEGAHIVLGINLRGAAYSVFKPHGHPIQPEWNEVYEDAQEMIRKYGCTDVYLSTEDQAIIDYFKEKFTIPVFWYQRKLLDYTKKVDVNNEPEKPYQSGKDYLISILMLAKTDYLLSSQMGSTSAVILFPEAKWKDKKIYELGYYD